MTVAFVRVRLTSFLWLEYAPVVLQNAELFTDFGVYLQTPRVATHDPVVGGLAMITTGPPCCNGPTHKFIFRFCKKNENREHCWKKAFLNFHLISSCLSLIFKLVQV